jgi:uncharacterized protein (DUF1501 family)
MPTLSRRVALKNGMLAIGSSLLAPGMLNALSASPAQADARLLPRANDGRILVVIQLAGGNDGLYALAPYADAAFPKLRPTLRLAKADVNPLNADLGLNKGLAAWMPLWSAGQMAVVENIGYPQQSLSHFQSMYIWQTLDTTGAQGSARTGWLGKYLQTIGASNHEPFTGLDSGSQLPTAFMAPGIAVPTVTSPKAFGITADKAKPDRSQTLIDFTAGFTGANEAQTAFATLLKETAQTAATGAAQLAKAAASYKPAVTYPQTPLADDLQLLAMAITQGLDMQVGYVSIGSFDTHATERTALDRLYPELAEAVAAFWGDMQKQGFADKVLLMTWSEFGRRAQENQSQGTDHGAAAPHFVIGNGVVGGIHGDPPGLDKLDDYGNLPFQYDFRSYYATILQNWLGVDPTAVLGGSYPILDFLK